MSESDKAGKIMPVYKYFGAKDGEGLKDFKAEWDQLSDQDKLELTEMAENVTSSS